MFRKQEANEMSLQKYLDLDSMYGFEITIYMYVYSNIVLSVFFLFSALSFLSLLYLESSNCLMSPCMFNFAFILP
jgi:hypothetical protein